MGKQTVSKIKKVLAILFAVLFVASLTSMSAGAAGSNQNTNIPRIIPDPSINIPRITTDGINLQKLTLEKMT
jgi:hypothetical protein